MTDWKEEVRNTIRNANDVKKLLNLSDEETAKIEKILNEFPMAVNPYYLSLVDFGDENDPILKMCIPSVKETDLTGSFDTSDEASNTVAGGLQHKYDETALVLSTNTCAMYCRHCFRKRLVGLSDDEIANRFDEVIEYIGQHPEVTNVILSGGDALLLSNEKLDKYLGKLCALDQLDFIRLASRTPVVLPQRISEDPALLDIFEKYNKIKQLYVVTQFNHPREINEYSTRAVKELTHRGIVVKNQTVLLNGVNAEPQVLGELLRKITSIGAVPYYIFQCRPVSGVRNQFQLPLEDGIKIVEEALSMQNGQGKCVKYCMSHKKGKIEILGISQAGEMLFKFHQAKDKENSGKIFARKLMPGQGWLPDEL